MRLNRGTRKGGVMAGGGGAGLDQFTISRMVRGVVGAFVPLFISLQTGDIKQGLWVFMGVLLLLQGEKAVPYPARMRYALTTSAIGMVGFLIGALVPGAGVSTIRDVILVLAMGVVSFAAGFMNGFGPAWSSGTLTLLMLASTSMDNDVVATHFTSALWFLVGVAVYEAMLLIEWAIMKDAPERAALVGCLEALHSYAQAVEHATRKGPTSPVDPLPISPTLADPVTKSRREAYQACVDGRRNLAASRWQVEGNEIIDSVGRRIARVTSARFLPEGLRGTDPAQVADAALDQTELVRNRKALPEPPVNQRPRIEFRARALWEYITHPEHDAVMQGVRLSLCMMTAVAVHRFVGTPHSYWIVVAVAMIAKPDYGSVYARAIQRSIGVLGGVAIGWAIFHFVPKGWPQAIVIIVLMAISPLARRKGYTVQAMIFTPLMLVFTNLILPGGTSVDYGPERLLATAIGAAIVVVVGYGIWPRSRERRILPLAKSARVELTHMLEVESSLSEAAPTEDDPSQLLDLPQNHDEHRLMKRRQDARAAEAALRTQLARSLTEPAPVATQAAMWTPASATLERLVDLATAAEWLPGSDAKSSSLERAAAAAAPAESKDPVPGNRPVTPLPAAPDEAQAELLRGIVVLASSLDTLTPLPHQVETAVRYG